VSCEKAQCSTFFDREFDGTIAVGLMFLLPELDPQKLIEGAGMHLTNVPVDEGGNDYFDAMKIA
jgi:hypothetical protein